MESQNHFIKQIIIDDLKSKKHHSIVTRFPPEPNGYLHLGHTKAIGLNFGLAKEFKGICHLRFDDTNPVAEEKAYVKAIQEDIRWLGYDWGDKIFYASDYFDKLYDFALQLIRLNQAYVDEQNEEQIRKQRGSLTEPGKPSPFRERSSEENLKLFEQMKYGKMEEGQAVLRAKIDMASPNMNMRDPIIYRILKKAHHRTGDKWCIYPLYDFTHGLSDMIEKVTHSLCTLEFEDHRPLYNWFLEVLKTPCFPQQIEFARGEVDYMLMSKRHLLALVENKVVSGWDDPRMPTIRGLRRRGYTPKSIFQFWERAGVTKKNSILSLSQLEWSVREDLNENASRAMAVLDPIKVIIDNYPEGKTEYFKASKHPKDETRGFREIPFAQEIYIEREDFKETPPPKYFRLRPGGKVRLKYAYVIECKKVIKDSKGRITTLHCDYDPRTKNKVTPEGEKKVKGIIHWVSANHAVPAQVRLYDRLFCSSKPGTDFQKDLNPQSLKIIEKAFIEPSLKGLKTETHVQFERLGFFITDQKDSHPEHLVFNRTVSLKDTWGKKV